MKEYAYSLELLNNIIKDDIPFSRALKNVCDKNALGNEEKKIISALGGCELRHHFVFEEVIKNNIEGLSDNSYLAIALCLSNVLFLKRFTNEESFKFVKDTLESEGQGELYQKAEELCLRKVNGEQLIDDSIDKLSIKFLSLRFNIPEWVAKLWTNNFSKNIAFKIAKSNSRQALSYLRVNELLAKKEDIQKKNPNFEYSEEEGLLLYNGKEPLKKFPPYINGHIFNENIAYRRLVRSLELDALKDIVLYSSFYNPILADVVVSTNGKCHVDQLVTPGNQYYEYRSSIKKYHLENVNVVECEVEQMITAVSKKVSTFIVTPENSRFDLIRYNPDFFLHFKREELDSIIEKEKSTLNEAAPFIEDNGQLVYAVSTINRKETFDVAQSFLKDHPDFYLKEEKQFLPYDSSNSCLYYAVFIKGTKQDD